MLTTLRYHSGGHINGDLLNFASEQLNNRCVKQVNTQTLKVIKKNYSTKQCVYCFLNVLFTSQGLYEALLPIEHLVQVLQILNTGEVAQILNKRYPQYKTYTDSGEDPPFSNASATLEVTFSARLTTG